MLGDFDIQSAAQEVLSTGRLVEAGTLNLENPTFEGGDSNILINGNITAGAAVRGAQSVLVKGSLIGSERWPCWVEGDGDVVVVGDVKYAHVKGRSVRIGAQAMHGKVNARKGMEVGGDLTDARIVVGEFDPEKRVIEEMKQKIIEGQQGRKFIDRQLKLDQKQMRKNLNRTSFVFDVNIGQIVMSRRDRIEINLQPFYKVVGERTDEEIDRALLEFFTKAVVGLFARTNQHLIRGNQSRQKIFKTMIGSLHDLFFLTRKLDNQSRQISRDKTELNELVEALSNQTGTVFVQGAVIPDIDLHFVLPDVEHVEDEDEEVFIGMQTAALTVRRGVDADQREVVRLGISGEDFVLSPEELQGILIRVDEGRVVWERIGTPVKKDMQ